MLKQIEVTGLPREFYDLAGTLANSDPNLPLPSDLATKYETMCHRLSGTVIAASSKFHHIKAIEKIYVADPSRSVKEGLYSPDNYLYPQNGQEVEQIGSFVTGQYVHLDARTADLTINDKSQLYVVHTVDSLGKRVADVGLSYRGVFDNLWVPKTS